MRGMRAHENQSQFHASPCLEQLGLPAMGELNAGADASGICQGRRCGSDPKPPQQPWLSGWEGHGPYPRSGDRPCMKDWTIEVDKVDVVQWPQTP